MQTNKKVKNPNKTFEGGVASHPNALRDLRRAVGTCLLFEDTFYQSGSDIAQTIARNCSMVDPILVAQLAIEARQDLHIRHAALFLCVQLIRMNKEIEAYNAAGIRTPKSYISDTIASVISRADELSEILAMYLQFAKKTSTTFPHQLVLGLQKAIPKFDEYQLAKYDRKKSIKLRDVFRIARPLPQTQEQSILWGKVVSGTLSTPNTWESRLAAGENKHDVFTDLLSTNSLGDMALLRNLRNMIEVNVDTDLIRNAIHRAKFTNVLPFRFLSAVHAAPGLSADLDIAMRNTLSNMKPKMSGRTVVVLDTSGSMHYHVSERSKVQLIDIAAGLGILVRGTDPTTRVFGFSNDLKEYPNLIGLSLASELKRDSGGATYLGRCLDTLRSKCPNIDRVIVITDEQIHDTLPRCWAPNGYIINVAAYHPALPVEQQGWKRVSGWSDHVVDWIAYDESLGT